MSLVVEMVEMVEVVRGVEAEAASYPGVLAEGDSSFQSHSSTICSLS